MAPVDSGLLRMSTYFWPCRVNLKHLFWRILGCIKEYFPAVFFSRRHHGGGLRSMRRTHSAKMPPAWSVFFVPLLWVLGRALFYLDCWNCNRPVVFRELVDSRRLHAAQKPESSLFFPPLSHQDKRLLAGHDPRVQCLSPPSSLLYLWSDARQP